MTDTVVEAEFPVLISNDRDVLNMKGDSYMLSWGPGELPYVFGTGDIDEVDRRIQAWRTQNVRTFHPFGCHHPGCPATLGYLYDMGKGVWTFTPKEATEPVTYYTIGAGVFIPDGKRVQFEKLRLVPVFLTKVTRKGRKKTEKEVPDPTRIHHFLAESH